MSVSRKGGPNPLHDLRMKLDCALDLLDSRAVRRRASSAVSRDGRDLIGECLDLYRRIPRTAAEPVRSIHHAACSGGTLIVKCLAAMPNVVVLNEVDPLSRLGFNPDSPSFRPSDIIALVRAGDRSVESPLLVRMFLESLGVVHGELGAQGRRLLLRDHCHGHFFTGERIEDRPGLLAVLKESFATLPLVTVRDPVDSYISIGMQEWMHFSPPTFDEYCRRYHAFLDEYEGVPVIRYEDFVREPMATAERICEILEIPFTPAFIDTFSWFRLSGDSGRSGRRIAARPRRPLPDGLIESAGQSGSYAKLAERLGYEPL
jgi:hypothetical protein